MFYQFTDKKFKIFIAYTSFAILSMAINIATQYTFLIIYDGIYNIELSIIAGTLFGLPIRYFLEKKYIFNFITKGLKQDSRLFFLYSFYGIFTTGIFWVTEYLFHLVFFADFMRYLGGVIGLSIGFFVKYQVDKRFVFNG
jgi:putative flippase GtrA